MIAQHDSRSPNADLPGPASLQLRRHGLKIGKEWLNETEQFFALVSESKWPALKQRDAQELFQLRHLSADCGLLDSIRNISHCLHDSSVAGHVIKQFEVMNVH